MAKPKTDRKIRLYLVDDHRVVRAGIRSILRDFPQMLVMGEAADATTALREVAELQPDLALVDLRLPDTDGIELCHRLKSLPQPPQVLLLTSFGEEDNVMAALGTGADGFILKTSDDDVLVAAITTVASGGTVWPSLAMRRFRENGQRPCKGSANKLHLLTAQERRVLALIAQGKTNKEIARTHEVSEKTVRNQVSSLMGKLQVERRTQAAAYFVKLSDDT